MYDKILVALDGSESSRYAGQATIVLARETGSRVIACHVYGIDIHRTRFADMETGLPEKYQEKEILTELRTTHGKLMDEGFEALSAGYVEEFTNSCLDLDITVESVAVEGRSYVGILNLAKKYCCDLISIGADGLGDVGNGMLGGTTTRILQSSPCDVLVSRCAPGSGPVLVGVDGSDEALKAVAKAVQIAGAMKKSVHLTAAYDPDFHTSVFNTMAQNLSPENQEKVGLGDQKKLHDEIIDKGLEKLYANFLCEAKDRFNTNGTAIKTFLVTGKAYCALDSQSRRSCADLIVISRHGHHRQQPSRLGSNAEGLLRTTSTNVLLVGGVGDISDEPKLVNITVESIPLPTPLSWDCDAQTRLKRVPFFVRNIAKRAVEKAIRQSGKDSVTADDFDSIAAKFGMGSREANS